MAECLELPVALVGARLTRTSWRRRVGALLAMTALLSAPAALATASPAAADCRARHLRPPYYDPGPPTPAGCNDEITLEDPNCQPA